MGLNYIFLFSFFVFFLAWLIYFSLKIKNYAFIFALIHFSITVFIVTVVYINKDIAQSPMFFLPLLIADAPVIFLYRIIKPVVMLILGNTWTVKRILTPFVFCALYGTSLYYFIGKFLDSKKVKKEIKSVRGVKIGELSLIIVAITFLLVGLFFA